MKDDLTALSALKQKMTAACAKVDRASGVLDQLMITLKKDWGCDSIEEAKKKLARLTKEVGVLSARLNTELEQFRQVWGAELEHLS
jgi:predicted  nucleic acid-binding Zn-ribbon protein